MRSFVNGKGTKEERVAIKLGSLLNDLYLDLDMVGYYIAQANPTVLYNRFIVVSESAQEQKEAVTEREMSNYNDRLW